MTWHVDTALIDKYATGALTDAGSASFELHVTTCGACRALVAGRAAHRVDNAAGRVKQAVDNRLDTVGDGWIERALRGVGIQDADARIVATALERHASWLLASVVALAFAAMATTGSSGPNALAAFLVAAPLVPVAGVGAAYGRRIDPVFELAASAPMPGARLVLLRTLAVTAPAIPVLLVVSSVLPVGSMSFAWLLPAAGLAGATLALGTFMPLARAATVLGAVWLLAAGVAFADAPRSEAGAFVREFAAFDPRGQLVFASLAAVSVALAALRRGAFETVR